MGRSERLLRRSRADMAAGPKTARLAQFAAVRRVPGPFDTPVEVTLLFSPRENTIAKEPGRAILSAGGVCLDSALQWWLRLLRVVPVGDSEPGSVFGPITGDPDPLTPSRASGSRLQP